MSDSELCHSTSKPIDDEENTLKSFMTFDITTRRPIFKVVVGSQIVVLPTIPPSYLSTKKNSLLHNNTPVTQTHDLDSNTICRTMSYAILPQNQLVMRKIHSNLL